MMSSFSQIFKSLKNQNLACMAHDNEFNIMCSDVFITKNDLVLNMLM